MSVSRCWWFLVLTAFISLFVTLMLTLFTADKTASNGSTESTAAGIVTEAGSHRVVYSFKFSTNETRREDVDFKKILGKQDESPDRIPRQNVSVRDERQRLVMSGCSRLAERQWTAEEIKDSAGRAASLFVDDKRRYIYCLVPKAACTTWTRVLLIASGKLNYRRPNDIPQNIVNFYRYKGNILRPLARYRPLQVEYRLKNYYKFMFVRHPLERMVSAFRDRVLGDHLGPRRDISQQIFAKIAAGSKLADKSRSITRLPSFAEFVQFVVDPTSKPRAFNLHWRPQFELCHPCQIHYDFIGHYETLAEDARTVLDALNLSSIVQFPYSDPDNQRKIKTAAKLSKMFENIPTSALKRLKTEIYANDFQLFGYEWNDEG